MSSLLFSSAKTSFLVFEILLFWFSFCAAFCVVGICGGGGGGAGTKEPEVIPGGGGGGGGGGALPVRGGALPVRGAPPETWRKYKQLNGCYLRQRTFSLLLVEHMRQSGKRLGSSLLPTSQTSNSKKIWKLRFQKTLRVGYFLPRRPWWRPCWETSQLSAKAMKGLGCS